MCGKIAVMDDTFIESCGSTSLFLFPKSKQTFKIKWQCVFFPKNIFKGGKATQPETPKIEHYRSSFEDLAF